jgi:hypothetical protein
MHQIDIWGLRRPEAGVPPYRAALAPRDRASVESRPMRVTVGRPDRQVRSVDCDANSHVGVSVDRDANSHVGVSTFTRFPCCSATRPLSQPRVWRSY